MRTSWAGLLLAGAFLAAPAAWSDTSRLSFFAMTPSDSYCCATSDSSGNLYLIGETASNVQQSLRIRVYDLQFNPISDFSYALTGSLTDDGPTAAAIDPSGNLWIAGGDKVFQITGSGTGVGAIFNIENGDSTGPARTKINAIAFDSSGNIFVAGTTGQSTFPTTVGAFQHLPAGLNTGAGWQYGFVVELSDRGAIQYASVLGGKTGSCSACAAQTVVTSLAVSSNGTMTVAGTTTAVDFPVSSGAYQGTGNAFVTRLFPLGSTLLFSTLFTGNPTSMGLEPDGSVVVGGLATCTSTQGTALGPTPSGSGFCVARINASGNALIFSTYLGGSMSDQFASLVTDQRGDIWISGSSNSILPLLPVNLSLGPGVFYEMANDGTRLLLTERLPVAGSLVANADGTFTLIGLATGCAVSSAFDCNLLFPYPVREVPMLHMPFTRPAPLSILGVADSGSATISGTVAPGEFFTIYGFGLGPSTPVSAMLDSDGRVTKQLAGVQVSFDTMPAPLLYVSGTQINVMAPYELQPNTTTTVEISTPAGSPPALELSVVPLQPNVLVITNLDGSVNSAAHPARGGAITIWAGGAGKLSGGFPDGSITPLPSVGPAPQPASQPVQVVLKDVDPASPCNQELQVKYAASPPGLVVNGLQVNALSPPLTCANTDLLLEIGGQAAPPVHVYFVAP